MMDGTKGKPRKPGRPSKPLSRQRLLSTAREVFAERGYAGASMAEIADRTGLRKGSLFHHVVSKEALYIEAMTEVVDHLHQRILEARMDEGSFDQRLDRLGDLVVTFLSERRTAAPLLLREVIDGGLYVKGPGGAAMQATMDLAVAFISAGVETKQGAGDDPTQLALSIVGLHLFTFAVPEIASGLLGQDLFTSEATEARRQAVLEHVRRLCRVTAGPARSPAGKEVGRGSGG